MDQIVYLPFWEKYNIWMLPSVSNFAFLKRYIEKNTSEI